MSNIFVEGFGTYGTAPYTGGPPTVIQQAMLSGRWAAVQGACTVSTLPWDLSNHDTYLICAVTADTARFALPATTDPVRISMYVATNGLPNFNNDDVVCSFRDTTNTVIANLFLQSTGTLELRDNNGALLAATSGPTMVAQSAAHLEMELNRSGGTFKLYFNQTQVINASGLTFTGSGGTAQIALGGAFSAAEALYFSHIVVRNSSGSYNNTFPIGDRRVATLWPNSDGSPQGWAMFPRKLYAAGLLDNTSSQGNNTGVTCANSAQTDLGSGDFTIEGWYRFDALPTGSNLAQLFGKWDSTNNRRSYQLYVGGPSLGGGNTVFQTSTDGTAGTVSSVFSFPYTYQIDTWYHIAVVRASSVTSFYVNGIQQGQGAADSRTYFAGTETTALGVQDNSGVQLANTSFYGFNGGLRLSVGYARYTTSFTPPSVEFPIGAGNDAHWSSVAWVSNWDSGINDQSQYARTLTAVNGAAFATPNDGTYHYQCINKDPPYDDTFIQAALLPATGTLTQSALPTNNDTVTLATKDGSTAAIYTWVTTLGSAFTVLIGATVAASLSNLMNAVNAGAGAGTVYGTGTTANHDVTASLLPGTQMLATANVPGTGGNSLASTTTDPAGSWTGTTLSGGANIPADSQFQFSRPPANATTCDSITILHREYKTDSGACTTNAIFVGHGGGTTSGTSNNLTTTPTVYADTIEQDPDTSAGVTLTTVVNGNVKMHRSA